VDTLRDDVEGGTTLDCPDCHHKGFEWIGLARDNGLDGSDDMGCRHDRVSTQVRLRRVCPLTGDRQLKSVSFSKKGSCAQPDLSKRQRVPQVHPKNKGDIRILEDSLLDAWLLRRQERPPLPVGIAT